MVAQCLPDAGMQWWQLSARYALEHFGHVRGSMCDQLPGCGSLFQPIPVSGTTAKSMWRQCCLLCRL